MKIARARAAQGVTVMQIAAAEALAELDEVADGIARAAMAMAMIEDRASRRPLHHASHGPPAPRVTMLPPLTPPAR